MAATALLVAQAPLAQALSSAAGHGNRSSSEASAGTLASWLHAPWGDKEADTKAKTGAGRNDAALDAGSLATITRATGARDVWASKDASGRAVTGKGVTVAVLDSGVDGSLPGLNAAGKVVTGPDLSLETNSGALRTKDTYGHGTFMAGIIAAKDPVKSGSLGQPQPSSDNDQLGMAPDARVLGVKLAATDGSTDVSQVIAALDWVVQHRNDNGMKIRVINLSYGTGSTQSYLRDPLAAAAENAWKKGIVVVASGGNEGPGASGLTNPATDPYLIAVGASTANNDKQGWGSLVAPATFTQHGTAARHVDLVAPGTSLVSLRATGSYLDTTYPAGRVAGDASGRLFRGSGTSQATAVVSGAAALLLQAYPTLTPDEVKFALVNSADPMSGSVLDRGAGQLDVARALAVAKRITAGTARTRAALYTQTYASATGLGSLEAARGDYHLTDPDTGSVLSGEVDVQNQPWNAASWRKASLASSAWTGGLWNGARWSGDSWGTSTAAWMSSGWSGARWSGARWSSVSWSGARWSGARWSGARWSGAHWQ